MTLRPTTLALSLCSIFLASGCSQLTTKPEARPAEAPAAAPAPATSPLSAQALYDLGRYYQGSMRHAEAIESFKDALARDASFADAHNALGVVYAEQGRYEEATREFRTAIELQPAVPYFQANLGYAYLLQGENKQALVALESAHSLEPDNETVAENLALARRRLQDSVNLTPGTQPATDGQDAAAAPKIDADATNAASERTRAASREAAPSGTAAGPTDGDAPVVRALPANYDVHPVALDAERAAAPQSALDTSGTSAEDAHAHTPADASWTPQSQAAVSRESAPSGSRSDGGAQPPDAHASAQAPRATDRSQPPADAARDSRVPAERVAPKEPGERAGTERRVVKAPLELEICNGSGVPGQAKSLAAALDARGLRASRVTSLPGSPQRVTELQYRGDYSWEAVQVKLQLPRHVVMVQTADLPAGVHVRVVLGTDFRNLQARPARPPAKVAESDVNGMR